MLEVTLRTDSAWEALKAIIAMHPTTTVGVGTVFDEDQMVRAKECGAAFAVIPRSDPRLSAPAQSNNLFYLPGVATASEVMLAHRAGYRFLKFFPAEVARGTAMLKSFARSLIPNRWCRAWQ